MERSLLSLTQIQQLVLDIQKIERNHTIPETEQSENVVEHSFAVSMLCWKLCAALRPDLRLEKIFQYCLVHDFLERGLRQDVNAYADAQTREIKQRCEAEEFRKINEEFADFPDMLKAIEDYESMADDEARFVWVVDKMQAILLGEMDDWRPYRKIAVTHQQFTAKGDEIMARCPDCLRPTLQALNEHSRQTFYDQPTTH